MLTLEVDGVIKGDVSPNASLAARWSHSLHPTWPFYRGLWFLTRDDSRVWEVVPVVSRQIGLHGAGMLIAPRNETERVAGEGTGQS
jgi:hypothetical protein